jgi:hypothetical protein
MALRGVKCRVGRENATIAIVAHLSAAVLILHDIIMIIYSTQHDILNLHFNLKLLVSKIRVTHRKTSTLGIMSSRTHVMQVRRRIKATFQVGLRAKEFQRRMNTEIALLCSTRRLIHRDPNDLCMGDGAGRPRKWAYYFVWLLFRRKPLSVYVSFFHLLYQ